MTPPALDLRRVTRVFGGLRAVDDVTLTVPPGQRRALIGPNGAGKTTLFNLISGDLRANTGEVRFDGRLLGNMPPYRRAQLGIGRTYQIPLPYGGMTTFENLLVSASFAGRKNEKEVYDHCAAVLEDCELLPHANRMADTLTLLNQSGLAADVLRLGHRIDTIAFYEGALRRAELKLSGLPVEFPYVVVLRQSSLENLLQQRLEQIKHVEVGWNCRLSELRSEAGAVIATIDKYIQTAKGYIVPEWDWEVDKTFHTRADFIVGADGYNSHVRQCLDIEPERVGEPELFVVYEFESDAGCGHEMRIVLGDTTTSVMWPLSDNRGRWGFQIAPADPAGYFPEKERHSFIVEEAPSEADSRHRLTKLITERAPWFEGNVKELGWSTDVQFERRLAREFGRNRCWLAGDAAHQTGPVGMQSMNIGLREGAELAMRLRKILREGASVDLLRAYSSDYRAEWRHLLGLNGSPASTDQANPWIITLRGQYRGENSGDRPAHPDAGPATIFNMFSSYATGGIFGNLGQIQFGSGTTPSMIGQRYGAADASAAKFIGGPNPLAALLGQQAQPNPLAALLGPDAKGLSATTITRLKGIWQEEYQHWGRRSLAGKQYVYVWADGIYTNVRLEEDRVCLLVLIGATPDGKKELIAVLDGYRESEQSWHELLVRLRDENALLIAPELAIGAIDEGGRAFTSPWATDLDAEYLAAEKTRQLEILHRRRSAYTPLRAPRDPNGRIAIVVDDGVATGATMVAALCAIRTRGPDRLVAAVGIASESTVQTLSEACDEVICLRTPVDFYAVGQFFEDFEQVTDAKVIELLESQKSSPSIAE